MVKVTIENKELEGYFNAINFIRSAIGLYSPIEADKNNVIEWDPEVKYCVSEVRVAVTRLYRDLRVIDVENDLTDEIVCENILYLVNKLFNNTFMKFTYDLKYYLAIEYQGFGSGLQDEENDKKRHFYMMLKNVFEEAKYEYGIA